MKKLPLLLLLCLSCSLANSQILCEWGDYNEYKDSYFNDVAVDDAGYTYVSGYFGDQIQIGLDTAFAQNSLDGFIMKYSLNGERMWRIVFSSTQTVLTRGMGVDHDGNTTIHGHFRGNLTINGYTINTPISSQEHGFVAQVNTNGSLTWIKEIIPSSNSYYAKYLEVDDAGNVLFEDYGSTTIDGSTENGPYTLTKLDQNGNVLWRYNKELNTSGIINNNLIAEFNNGYVIAGRISDTTVVAGNTIYPVIDTIIDQWNDTTISVHPEVLLIFLDANGNEVDVRRIQGSLWYLPFALYSTNSTLYLTGRVNGYLTNGTQSVFTNSAENYVMAYDNALTPLFLERSTAFECRGLYANQSHIYAAGIKGGAGYLEKFDTQGIFQDTMVIASSGVDYLQDIRGYDNGNVVVVGISSETLTTCGFTMNPLNGFGAYVLKLDGEVVVSHEELEYEDQTIVVYPNPTNSKLTITTPFDSGSIALLTLDGKTVLEYDFNGMHSVELDCSEYASGVYMLSVTDNVTKPHIQRVIIE